MKFWPSDSYYKRSDWKLWLSERFSEALNLSYEIKKKMHAAEGYKNGSKLKYIHPPMALSKIFNSFI